MTEEEAKCDQGNDTGNWKETNEYGEVNVTVDCLEYRLADAAQGVLIGVIVGIIGCILCCLCCCYCYYRIFKAAAKGVGEAAA